MSLFEYDYDRDNDSEGAIWDTHDPHPFIAADTDWAFGMQRLA